MRKELAILNNTTMFEKTIRNYGPIIQSVKNNPKMGKGKNTVIVKRWRGMRMYQITLVERETCPTTCLQWSSCYGNNSPFRSRQDINRPDFYTQLETELKTLNNKHTNGFIIRLHLLGDFPNVEYTKSWLNYLDSYPNLHIFGYTHHDSTSQIGRIVLMANISNDRWRIRFSDSKEEFSANVEEKEQATGIICPEQTGKSKSCLTCGLCWAIDRPITFLPH